jgi:hypothetical protein
LRFLRPDNSAPKKRSSRERLASRELDGAFRFGPGVADTGLWKSAVGQSICDFGISPLDGLRHGRQGWLCPDAFWTFSQRTAFRPKRRNARRKAATPAAFASLVVITQSAHSSRSLCGSHGPEAVSAVGVMPRAPPRCRLTAHFSRSIFKLKALHNDSRRPALPSGNPSPTASRGSGGKASDYERLREGAV